MWLGRDMSRSAAASWTGMGWSSPTRWLKSSQICAVARSPRVARHGSPGITRARTNVPLVVRAPSPHPGRVTLASAPFGVPLLLGRATLPVARRLRLAELGLRTGATVTVLRRTAGGGRIVGVGDARVAVGRNVLLQVPAVPTAHSPRKG